MEDLDVARMKKNRSNREYVDQAVKIKENF